MPNNPLMAKTWFDTGIKFFDEGKFEQAILAFTTAIDSYPSDSATYTNRGMCYLGLEKQVEAISDFQMALWLQPDSPEANYGMAVALLRQHENEDAVRFFERAAALGSQVAQENLVETLQSVGSAEFLNAETKLLLREAVHKFPFMATDGFIWFVEQVFSSWGDLMVPRIAWLREIASEQK